MNTKKILIVDTDQDFLTLLASRLKAREYSVLSCDSSPIAVRLVQDESPDLVLLDSEMESIGGDALAHVIKEQTHNYFLPVIMMTERDNITTQIMSMHRGYDDFIMKPFSSLELQMRIEMVLKGSDACIQANPLTRLPGNNAIGRTINKMIASGEKYSIAYIDIDNFKSFNDKYGFDKGDDIIIQTARILKHAARAVAAERDVFIGHVGGDDFVFITHPDSEEKIALFIIEEFDRLIPTHYNKEDRERGSLVVTNRRGKEECFPLASISIASVTNCNRSFSNMGEIAQTAAEVKKFLKSQAGSNYLRDRREQQLDSISDAERLFLSEPARETEPPEEPLGQILLNAGLISEQQLQEALRRHFTTGQRLGRVLITMKAISAAQVGEMLERKLGVPYISLKDIVLSPRLARLFSDEYIRMHGVLPFDLRDKTLCLAMIDPFDLHTIDDIERITGYRVSPYITLEEEFSEFLEKKTMGEV
jgi:diguanylate cyclase (GGDEF)-like protein